MHKTRIIFSTLLFSALLLASHRAFALDQPFDHSLWDQFLKKYVNDQGEVNYRAAKEDPVLLDAYLAKIKDIPKKEFRKTWPREEKMALLINAYHAGLIKAVLDHYPVDSIQDIPGIWDLEIINIAGNMYSLNRLQDSALMRTFRDEKIHAALSCGAKSCPQLSRDAYTGPLLEGQLFMATRKFVNDDHLNKIEPGSRSIDISPILKWHARDFLLDFGPDRSLTGIDSEKIAILSFLSYYLEDQDKIRFLEGQNYKVKYQPFNWQLNDWLPGKM